MNRTERMTGIILLGIGALATLYRFGWGLGASTNLTDDYPWGLWIGVDLAAIAAAAGGFTIAFTLYILGRREFRRIGRLAVLAALFMYPTVMAFLVLDLGQPQRFWHTLVFWNPRSPMFEVACCLMLYTAVLAVEFSPEICRRFDRARWGERLHGLMPLVAGCGVILSTLHQSSLGSLYLIAPLKMHPFWYSPALPTIFFLTALPCGLGLTVLAASYAHARFGAAYESDAMRKLRPALIILTAIALVARVSDLVGRNPSLFAPSYESGLLGLELATAFILPLIVLAMAFTPARLVAAAALIVAGVAFHRLNVSITAWESWMSHPYFPSGIEILTTLFLIVVSWMIFTRLVKFLEIYPRHQTEHVPLATRETFALLASVLAVFIAAFLLVRPASVAHAELSAVDVVQTRTPGDSTARTVEIARIDVRFGETEGVVFPHAAHLANCLDCHVDSFGLVLPSRSKPSHDTASCGSCHDGARAFGTDTACLRCHRLEAPTRIQVFPRGARPGGVLFDHAAHTGRASSCRECHAVSLRDGGMRGGMASMYKGESCGRCHNGRRAFTARRCGGCHHDG